ncbi:MAG TPA: SAM-dependent DNA methyltransferase [Candidatus Spyradosoma merdigallinarum]|uniref:site-specific DNA-methyltransferase (adenine-specific) n=1 Tax=Candidatus Spyradosoma merdigallinarum TaxID=2840950 RepID=A0A9D1NJL4_9BACT|nr:SAM-dependent DNA methyltransferase [Candidatus Spyradosoma merdigallinarum]
MKQLELEKRTSVNVQEKADLIWAIADKLVGIYKPHEYGNVILPMCVIKRFSDTLAPTKAAVLAKNAELERRKIAVKSSQLCAASGYDFYNVSPFSFESLRSTPEQIAENFRFYLQGFSENVIDIIQKFNFDNEITKLADNGILFSVIDEFCTKKAYLGADAVSAVDMGYVFEELVRKFSESYDEHAGAHFTARDIIYMMAELLVAPNKAELRKNGITAMLYDMAMGTSQMLDCLAEKLLEIDPEADLHFFGQELNEQTFAIAKANMLIRGEHADNMKHGNTLSDDKFGGYLFDYVISNPPFGIEWKNEKKAVEAEARQGDAGRFGAGLPSVGDSQQLFLLNGVAKLKDSGRMAIIQNGSPLFKGDAGSGESEIRGFLLENDWLEAVVQLPNDMFYNTGISTYIWLVSKNKARERRGKVQLIDASRCFEKRRKSLGNKRNEFTERCIALVAKAYLEFSDAAYSEAGKIVESKIRDNDDFKFTKITVERPLRDENGAPVLKKGKPQIESDTESVPFKEDVGAYMRKNVLPYVPDAKINPKKTKIGYEIPFTREFYKYVPPRPSAEIFEELRRLGAQEAELMKKILGK